MAVKWAEDSAKLAKSKQPMDILVMPGIHYGFARHHMAFPGTITLSFETLKQVVFEVGDSVLTHGFKKLVISMSMEGKKLRSGRGHRSRHEIRRRTRPSG